jgi:pantoate--beta-alanine ligase
MPSVVAEDLRELAAARGALGRRSLALVPTMGALHEGHLSLIRAAHDHADAVAVSIFVNPMQFGPGEDFDRYPRTLDADLETCTREGVDLVFAPGKDVVYPRTPRVTVRAGHLGTVFEGAIRPGHFDGVLTVVAKLFGMIRPDVAIFGEKDAQQLALIRLMVADLNLPVRIVGRPIVREPDGLALSSRNRYLSAVERATALGLSRALRAGVAAAGGGVDAVRVAARRVLDEAAAADPPLGVDYLILVDPAEFAELSPGDDGPAVLAVAGRVGDTRLIDNMRCTVAPAGASGAAASGTGASAARRTGAG